MNPQSVYDILFGAGDRRRFTQDTPILPEVWQHFAAAPDERHDVLITPFDSVSANRLMRDLLQSFDREHLVAAAPVALRGFVALQLTFDELIDLVLPRTAWAHEAVGAQYRGGIIGEPRAGVPSAFPRTRDAQANPTRYEPHGSGFEVMRILWLMGAILNDRASSKGGAAPATPDNAAADATAISRHVEDVMRRMTERLATTPSIWRVTMNRRLDLSDEQSRSTVKADAAHRVFDVKANAITWAVIDSGIDTGHPGFNDGGTCRVTGSYDLASLRALLNAGYQDKPADNPQLAIACAAAGISKAKGLSLLKAAYRAYATDVLDWSSIEPLIRLSPPPVPIDGHGTHVAGIIGANWREADDTPIVVGLCPDIRLLDLRILSDSANNTEFAVIGALQFIRYLNARNDYIAVHGVNLSLSIPHVVENYACGRTPVCDECEKLVGAGVTVVAAAGNQGYHGFTTLRGNFNSYATLSITDPGNAECVITVGSTHKREPHTYGISYFSSRGPTGDGRAKPDLVAPGERIRSTLPNGEYGPLDGTSQAAPHVSAAAAMLMARFPELIGQPRRIKALLCESATDLGREQTFQGHGLLDTLRALQSF